MVLLSLVFETTFIDLVGSLLRLYRNRECEAAGTGIPELFENREINAYHSLTHLCFHKLGFFYIQSTKLLGWLTF